MRFFGYEIHFNEMFESDSGCLMILLWATASHRRQGSWLHMLTMSSAPNRVIMRTETPLTFPQSPWVVAAGGEATPPSPVEPPVEEAARGWC